MAPSTISSWPWTRSWFKNKWIQTGETMYNTNNNNPLCQLLLNTVPANGIPYYRYCIHSTESSKWLVQCKGKWSIKETAAASDNSELLFTMEMCNMLQSQPMNSSVCIHLHTFYRKSWRYNVRVLVCYGLFVCMYSHALQEQRDTNKN
jgi:hypothetical protein